MKKATTIFIMFVFTLILASCVTTSKYPNMVEYNEDYVLDIAKSKYDISEFIITGLKLHGQYESQENNTIYESIKLIDSENLESAMKSFAGVEGGKHIQAEFHNFLSYYAIAKTNNDEVLFIYYNLNLDKKAPIYHMLGSSKYPYDVLPTEVSKNIFTNSPNERLNNAFTSIFVDSGRSEAFDYSRDNLSITGYPSRQYSNTYMEFYKEDECVVFDFYHMDEESDNLIYSSSKRYGLIWNAPGIDISKYFEVTKEVTPSQEDTTCDLLKATIKLNEDAINGTVIFSYMSGYFEYKRLNEEGKVISDIDKEGHNYTKEIKISMLMERIEGINHSETTIVKLNSCFILYEITQD